MKSFQYPFNQTSSAPVGVVRDLDVSGGGGEWGRQGGGGAAGGRGKGEL